MSSDAPGQILNGETLISSTEACRCIPGRKPGHSLHKSSFIRNILKGAKAVDGRTVRLEAVRFGSRWLTSREAIARFVTALVTPADPQATATPPSPSARQRASDRAAAELERIGI